MTRLALATEYLRAGWAVVPVKGKIPIGDAWQTLRLTVDDLPKHFSNGCNIGGLLGAASGGRVDVDLDCPEAVTLAPRFLPATGAVFGRESSRSSHRIYFSDGAKYLKMIDPAAADAERATIVELRQDGHQTVLPGSMHPSGEEVRWEMQGEPGRVEPGRLETAVKRLSAAVLLARHYPRSGSRHEFTLYLAGALIRAGWTKEEAEHFIREVAELARDEEASAREGNVETTIAKIEAGQPAKGFRSLKELLDPKVATALSRWLGVRAETDPDEEEAHLTDLGNSIRFARQHADRVWYCHDTGSWCVWNEGRWNVDETKTVLRLARETVRAHQVEAIAIEDEAVRKKAVTFALSSESGRAIREMVKLAESDPEIATTSAAFDLNADLLNVKNGTLDLQTFELRTHDPDDRITKMVPVPYTPDALAPRWERFLLEIFQEDLDLLTYVQRAVGYTLTGDTSEHALFLLHGLGANGKSTFIEVLQHILGNYSVTIRMDSLMATKGNVNTPDVANLQGARLAVAMESDAGQRLNEGLIKTLSGGDRITACRKYEHPVTFSPTHKLWLATNHRPTVRGGDLAIWRRIRLVPFLQTFQGDQRDPHLKKKLLAEAEGVLAWAVEGARMWREKGLGSCRKVEEHTREYRNEQDLTSQFINDECEVARGLEVSKKALYDRFKAWLADQGEYPVSQKVFSIRLKECGLPIRERRDGKLHRWVGIGLGG